MAKDFAKEEEKVTEGAPVCEKCGNAMLWESFDGAETSLDPAEENPTKGEWVCPHCQGEIDFLGEEDE